MTALIYRSPWIYDAAMRLVYGRYAEERTAALAKYVTLNSSVLELCCGTGTLYRKQFKQKHVQYLGVDANPRFVATLQKGGISAVCADVRHFSIAPNSYDFIVMQGSLSEFRPNDEEMVQRMLGGARKAVLITESVRHLAHSSSPWVARWVARVSQPIQGAQEDVFRRFTEQELKALMQSFRKHIAVEQSICGGRTLLYVLNP